MLDSIREIFDILGYNFETIGLNFIHFKRHEELVNALDNGLCPVVDVLNKYLSPGINDESSHAMVATGIKSDNGSHFIQLKNSYADNPNEHGKVQKYSIRQER